MVMPPPTQQIIRESVQDVPQAIPSVAGTAMGWFGSIYRGPLLPPRFTRERELALRRLYAHDYNTLFQGAVAGLIKRVKSTPWEIKGDDTRGVEYFQAVLRDAQFGEGWGSFLSRLLTDYFRQDGGGYFEIIAPGDPLFAPTGATIGLAVLDSLRCYPTADPLKPVVYWSRYGKLHVMHHSRIRQFVDMPETDDANPGYGMCALSRAAAVVDRQILMSRYIHATLDDSPPPGLVIASGMSQTERQRAYNEYKKEQSTDTKPEWGRQLWFYSPDPTIKPSIEVIPFSEAPEKFDWKTYNELDVDELALALGIDRQEIWQLTGGNIGSAQQSQILNEKSRGKTLGDILTSLERLINDILPESLEFEFKRKDSQEDRDNAQVLATYAQALAAVGTAMTDDEKRQMLANVSEPVADAITDAQGRIRRVNDLDVQPEPNPVTVDDATQGQPAPDTSAAVTETDQKDYSSTRRQFVTQFTDLVNAGLQDEMSRRRAGIVMRALLNRLGRQMFNDGLKAGGVDAPMDTDDLAEVQQWLARQSQYVTNFLNTIYKSGLTEKEISARAEAWSNKSLDEMFQAGRLSADKNGLYVWRLGVAEEHCSTCSKLNGQVHRLKEYHRRGWLPKVEKLACRGYQCACSLEKAPPGVGARGQFPK